MQKFQEVKDQKNLKQVLVFSNLSESKVGICNWKSRF